MKYITYDSPWLMLNNPSQKGVQLFLTQTNSIDTLTRNTQQKCDQNVCQKHCLINYKSLLHYSKSINNWLLHLNCAQFISNLETLSTSSCFKIRNLLFEALIIWINILIRFYKFGASTVKYYVGQQPFCLEIVGIWVKCRPENNNW